MFAIRKAVQESSGLNPSELVFAHILHIPLKFVVGRDRAKFAMSVTSGLI